MKKDNIECIKKCLFQLECVELNLDKADSVLAQAGIEEEGLNSLRTAIGNQRAVVRSCIEQLEDKIIKSVAPMTNEKLLKLVNESDQKLLDGEPLYRVQEQLREFEYSVNTMPLAERYQAACYSRTKDRTLVALIHCRGLLVQMVEQGDKK